MKETTIAVNMSDSEYLTLKFQTHLLKLLEPILFEA